MDPAVTEPRSKSDSAVLGILAGLGIGLAIAFACVFLFVLVWGSYGVVVAVPFLLPPATVAAVGVNARRNKRPKFAAGLFIAAAVVALLEGTCATQLWR
jgi:hypothetical protein